MAGVTRLGDFLEADFFLLDLVDGFLSGFLEFDFSLSMFELDQMKLETKLSVLKTYTDLSPFFI